MDILAIVLTISFATGLCTLNLLSCPASIPLKPILVPSWVPSIYVYTLSAVPPCCLSVLQVSHDSLFGFLSQTIVCSATVDCADYLGCCDDNGCFIEHESAVLCMHLGHTKGQGSVLMNTLIVTYRGVSVMHCQCIVRQQSGPMQSIYYRVVNCVLCYSAVPNGFA